MGKTELVSKIGSKSEILNLRGHSQDFFSKAKESTQEHTQHMRELVLPSKAGTLQCFLMFYSNLQLLNSLFLERINSNLNLLSLHFQDPRNPGNLNELYVQQAHTHTCLHKMEDLTPL